VPQIYPVSAGQIWGTTLRLAVDTGAVVLISVMVLLSRVVLLSSRTR
jgi:hypothetical protein